LLFFFIEPGKTKQNMEHKCARTTFDDIGTPDAYDRQLPNAVFIDVASYLREALPTLSYPEK
jgi:hypothetical protein